jgi:hypothetical protein
MRILRGGRPSLRGGACSLLEQATLLHGGTACLRGGDDSLSGGVGSLLERACCSKAAALRSTGCRRAVQPDRRRQGEGRRAKGEGQGVRRAAFSRMVPSFLWGVLGRARCGVRQPTGLTASIEAARAGACQAVSRTGNADSQELPVVWNHKQAGRPHHKQARRPHHNGGASGLSCGAGVPPASTRQLGVGAS